ncbi:MAG: DUF131 domain-containing protein [Candidatus Methanofastidiosia archaeon]
MGFEKLIALGILLIFFGMLLVVLGILFSSGEGEVKGGGIVMIGPIPIIFGNDKRLVLLMGLIAIVLMALWFLRSRG